MKTLLKLVGFCTALIAQLIFAEEPALPLGLKAAAPQEPALPLGISAPASPEPSLPAGLDTPADSPQLAPPSERTLPKGLSGFWELRGGSRLQNDPYEKTASLGETRLQLQLDKASERIALKVGGDFLYDPVLNEHRLDLEDGDGWFDLRQANLLLRPASFVDLKLGRQINTWGTGDMLFINDLFSKDWNSYFIGRDDEYLKAPSDSAKASFFSEWANLDLIYSPRFDSDRYIDGHRLSYWNANQGRLAGRNATVYADKPDDSFRDDEWSARLYRTIGSYEIAAYGYDGFWKSPAGSDPESGQAIFPRLQVFGSSARGPFASGILSLETGWYRSADDLDGNDPFVRNSEMRYLIGYEQELARNLTGGLQYYVEQMMDYDAYQRMLPTGLSPADEYRQVVTLRLTKLLMSQNLQLGTFIYFSPTDLDAYLRPKASYKIDDHWIVERGGNLFFGEDDQTFFGQFERNNNLYASLRYGF